MHDSTPKVVNHPAFIDNDRCSHAFTYELDDSGLKFVLVYQLLDYYILLLLKPSLAITVIFGTIRTFVIVSPDPVRTLFDAIQDHSRTTAQRLAVMKYYNESLVITL